MADHAFADRLLAAARTPAFESYLADLLTRLCAVDTTPTPEVAVMQRAEAAAFTVLEHELGALPLPGLTMERRPINPAIAKHPAYSQLHFTKTPARPRGLTPRQVYRQRANLLCCLPGADGAVTGGVAVNAHVDVIAPYFPPRLQDGILYSRGACDDKGAVAAIVGALKLLAALGLRPPRPVTAMFVVEEETGGNGSLSLALDRELKQRYDRIVVCECTELRLFPANRGAIWYKAELKPAGLPLLESAAFVIEELEKEGRAIRAESRHPLFPQRPVQTCHGILGHIGQHPSRICGEISVDLHFTGGNPDAAEAALRDCLDSGLAEYTGLYGDKTVTPDPTTGKPKVHHHLDLSRTPDGFTVAVHGSTGHMGAILENDGAITKMATLVRALCRSRPQLERLADAGLRLALSGFDDSHGLILEGGQGFLPTHAIDDVMARVRRAAGRGVANFAAFCGVRIKAEQAVKVTYDKLHNAAFDGDPASPAMQQAIAAAKACGMWQDEPVVGWHVSCDARLFATEYPGLPVITAGPGKLTHAHSDQEQVRIADVRQFAEFLAHYLMM